MRNHVMKPADRDVATRQSEPLTPIARHEIAIPAGGVPLEPHDRKVFESRFGHDFSTVRVHSDQQAAEMARAMHAKAYTIGSSIAFGASRYEPGTEQGHALLAHELVHVLQQRKAGPSVRDGTTSPTAGDELEAADVSQRVLQPASGSHISVSASPTALVQRSILPVEPPEAYLPDAADLLTRLNLLDAAGRQAFVTPLLMSVQAHYVRAEAAGVIPMLAQARVAETKMATSPVQPVSGLPQNTPGSFRENVMLDAGGAASTELGRKLVKKEITAIAVSATGPSATEAVMNLRRLDDVLTRILSAKAAADQTGTPLAQVLAMYRTEGDLNAPPSTASLAAGVPSGTHDATTSLSPTTPEISHLVWLIDAAIVGSTTDLALRELALASWFVQIGGLDEVGGLASPRQLTFAAWSSANWLRAMGLDASGASPADRRMRDDAAVEADTRWTTLLNNTEISRPGSDTGLSTAVMVTPKSPEIMVAGILAEAVMRQRALGKTTSLVGAVKLTGPGSQMTAGLSYLHYHAGTEQMQQILASGAIAAAGTTGPRYSHVRSAMQGSLDTAVLRAKMSKVDGNTAKLRGPVSAAEKATLETENTTLKAEMWALVVTWVTADPTRLAALGEFIETASTSQWSAWQEHRGNLSRYNVLQAYYALLK